MYIIFGLLIVSLLVVGLLRLIRHSQPLLTVNRQVPFGLGLEGSSDRDFARAACDLSAIRAHAESEIR